MVERWVWVDRGGWEMGWLWVWVDFGGCDLICDFGSLLWFCDSLICDFVVLWFVISVDVVCDFVIWLVGFWVFVVIWFWLSFGRGGGCDLILAGFQQWCVVRGDELEKLRPWRFRRRAQFKREGSKGWEGFESRRSERGRRF